MYLIATLELSYGGVADFLRIAPLVREAMESRGCKMLNAMMQGVGRLNTIVHLWDIPSANHYFEAVEGLKADPRFPEIIQALANAVVNETLVFAEDTPYAPARQ